MVGGMDETNFCEEPLDLDQLQLDQDVAMAGVWRWHRSNLAKLDKINRQFDAEIELIERLRSDAVGQLEDRVEETETRLRALFAAHRDTFTDKGEKPPASIKFPFGTIKANPPKVQIHDAGKLVVWAEENNFGSLVETPEPKEPQPRVTATAVKSAIVEDRFMVNDDGEKVDIPEHVTYIPSGQNIVVKPV